MVHTLILSSIINIFIGSSAYLDAFTYNSTILPGYFRVSQLLVFISSPGNSLFIFFSYISPTIYISDKSYPKEGRFYKI